ncbi:MAG: hypothetical protein CMI03_05555 [Oceanospirillaceae bacterium]|nr:hypothetical protein [Oceanospirillaceae bacterium]
MYKNYKKLLTLFTLALQPLMSTAAVNSSGASVWFDTGAVSALSPAQIEAVNADTLTFWNNGEPNDSGGEDCATQQAAGGWNDVDCGNSNRPACFDGTDWVLGNSSNFSAVSCPLNTVFAAPVTAEQRDLLIAAMNLAGVSTVYINATDSGSENTWLINATSASAFAPFWSATQPDNAGSGEHCTEVQSNGEWNDIACTEQRAVVCSDASFDNWQVTVAQHSFTNIDRFHQICQQAFGINYQFSAPRTAEEQSALNNVLSTSAFINASDQKVEGFWMLNQRIFSWATGFPDTTQGLCVVARQSDGQWLNVDCASAAFLTCTDGNDWIIRNASHIFANAVLDVCARPDNDDKADNPYRNYYLAAPQSEYERARVADLIRAEGNGARTWINLRYTQDTVSWIWNGGYKKPVPGGDLRQLAFYDVYDNDYEFLPGPWVRYGDGASLDLAAAQKENLASYSLFAPVEPNNTGDCVQLYTDASENATYANWDDTSCATVKHVACYNGYQWRVSPVATSIGGDDEYPENLVAAFAACAAIEEDGVAGNFVFASPISFQQTRELLAEAIGQGYTEGVWININDKRYEGTFVYNLGMDVLAPFWAQGSPDGGSAENCAVQQSAGNWDDVSCSGSLPVACFDPGQGNNGNWQITPAAYTGGDFESLANICQSTFDGRYKFYAPVTLAQKNDLLNVMAGLSVTQVFINASDTADEDRWQLNRSINNWQADQPSTANSELCVSADLTTGLWRARDCSDELPVACSSGSIWSFSDVETDLLDFSNAQSVCDDMASGLLFSAPRLMDSLLSMQHDASLAGRGGDVWINGNRLRNAAQWQWNDYRVALPNWGNAQPDGGSSENCALLMNDSAGSWADEGCDTSNNRPYLCRDGDNWAVSIVSGSLDDFSQAVAACQDLGSGWQFAAPQTYNENIAARNAMGGVSEVWINATDTVKEGQWLTNAANISAYPAWAPAQPDNGGLTAAQESTTVNGEDCVYQDAAGDWYDISCSGAAEYSWACTDGYQWKVTREKGLIQNTADGHRHCFIEYGSRFVFAVPLTLADAIQLDFARLQASLESANAINRVWLNITDGGDEDNQNGTGSGEKFRKNLPYTNWLSPYPGREPQDVCVFKTSVAAGQNNPWRSASCTAGAAHYACFNGSDWQGATSAGALVNGSLQIVPQTGDDYWSYERGNRLCKDQFGRAYYFSAPVTAAEEQALDTAIRNSPAQVKNTWLNYYYVSNISSENNRWFADRLKLGLWQKPEFANYNNSDCALLDSNGRWSDVLCNREYDYACFDGDWSIASSTSGQWQDGFAACENQNAMFAVPRTPDELAELLAQLGGNTVWINLTDTGLESQWIANRLRYAWWADNEPVNTGNRDCARISTNGEWYAAKCLVEEAAFACRKLTGSNVEWFITSTAGVWSRGFSVCAAEFPGSEFFAPHAFGNQSATLSQQALAAEVATFGQDVWLNMSDQEVEGSWRPYQVYSDWATESLLDEDNDCAYFDRVTEGAGTW